MCGRCAVVIFGSRFRAVDAGAPFGHVEIKVEDALFAQNPIGQWRQSVLENLSHRVAMRGEEQVLHELLRDRGSSPANLSRLAAFLHDFLKLVPIDAMMPIESPILRRDHSVLKFWRDPLEG